MQTPRPATGDRTAIADAELEALIQAASLAPSPDNNQPWRFCRAGASGLWLYHDSERALPSDVDRMFSMLALGAALENLCMAARTRGWEPAVTIVVDGSETPRSPVNGSFEPVARIGLAPAQPGSEPLYPYLSPRCTCRKPFARQAVAVSVLNDLEAEVAGYPETALHWLSGRREIRSLALLVARTDRLRFEYQPFHTELFRQLRFSAQQAEETRDGLDVRCLEVPSPGLLLLRGLRSWRWMSRLNRLGLSRFMSLPSMVQVWRTGTIGLVTTSTPTHAGYLRAGRVLQRVWLRATATGLAFHPLGSLPIFLSRLERPAGPDLSAAHERGLRRTADKFFKLFPTARGRGLALLFRLGKAAAPEVRSLRRPVADLLDVQD